MIKIVYKSGIILTIKSLSGKKTFEGFLLFAVSYRNRRARLSLRNPSKQKSLIHNGLAIFLHFVSSFCFEAHQEGCHEDIKQRFSSVTFYVRGTGGSFFACAQQHVFISSIPSISCSTNGPSLHSSSMLGSRHSTPCHTFLGMSTP